MRCSTIIWIVPGAREVGASIRKNHTPRNPAAGQRHSATSVAASTGSSTSAYGTTSPARCTQNVPYSKTRGLGHALSPR